MATGAGTSATVPAAATKIHENYESHSRRGGGNLLQLLLPSTPQTVRNVQPLNKQYNRSNTTRYNNYYQQRQSSSSNYGRSWSFGRQTNNNTNSVLLLNNNNFNQPVQTTPYTAFSSSPSTRKLRPMLKYTSPNGTGNGVGAGGGTGARTGNASRNKNSHTTHVQHFAKAQTHFALSKCYNAPVPSEFPKPPEQWIINKCNSVSCNDSSGFTEGLYSHYHNGNNFGGINGNTIKLSKYKLCDDIDMYNFKELLKIQS